MRLRTKLAAAIAAVSALGAVGLGYWVHNAYDNARQDNARQSLDAQLRHAVDVYNTTTDDEYRHSLEQNRLPPALAQAIETGSRATYLDLDLPEPKLWAATMVGGRALSVSKSYDSEQQATRDLDRILLYGGIGSVLLTSTLGALLAQGLSRRVRTAAGTARRIADGELDVRVQQAIGTRGRDEVTELGAAVDAMSAALQARLEVERRVTADIAHELRTPVTSLVTSAGLLPPGRPSELVQDGVRVLRALIEDVLEVARLDAEVETCELVATTSGALARAAVEDFGAPVELEIERDAEVDTDPRRVRRILSNLLTNARLHGAPPVSIRVDGSRIEVRDHGPGFPAHLLDHGPQRFATGGQGHGLGLTIVTGQAGVIGATLTLSNAADGGGKAVLDLAPSAG